MSDITTYFCSLVKVMFYFHKILLLRIMRRIVELALVSTISYTGFVFKINAETIVLEETVQLTLVQILDS